MAELGFTAEIVAARARALLDELDDFELDDESDELDDKEDA
jgi:hypothetical protein